MGKTRLTVILALLCMAVACHEAHLDCSSEQVFNDSLMKMYAEHSLVDAKDFGVRLIEAQDALGKETVRKALQGMNWAEANAYIDRVREWHAPPASPDPAKG